MTLDALNRMNREEFAHALGWVFEQSPWVAKRTWPLRPFASVEDLHQAMVAQVASATPEEQIELIRAHPDLGERARMSSASLGEQTGAGLDRLSPEEFEMLHRLNAAYREKFGFPFIYAVKGSTKQEILGALQERLAGDAARELPIALAQIYRIAQFRLEDTIHA